MITWTRGNNRMLSAHFNAKEFTCSCGICSLQGIEERLLEKLELLREQYGAPIRINSGYRCELRQDQLRKQGYETATGTSSHTEKLAADIAGDDMPKLTALADVIFDNMGVANTFLHVDIRPVKPGQKRRWSYKK